MSRTPKKEKLYVRIVAFLKDIFGILHVEFLPGLFVVFDTVMTILGFKYGANQSIFIVLFIIFMVINCFCYIYLGYNIYKHKQAIGIYKTKTLTHLTHHRESIKNIMDTENNRNKLLILLQNHFNATYHDIESFYGKFVSPHEVLIDEYVTLIETGDQSKRNDFEQNHPEFYNSYSMFRENTRILTRNFVDNVKDTHNRFFSYTFAKVKNEIEHYLRQQNIELDVSVTLKLFYSPCQSIHDAMLNPKEYFVYTSFRDNATYRNTKRREIGQNKYSISNQTDFCEAMKSPNYHYIYNNLAEEENTISSAYCLSYYNCGATVSLRMPNNIYSETPRDSDKTEHIYYGFLCCDVFNRDKFVNPIDIHVSNILEIYGHIISEFLRSLEDMCDSFNIMKKGIFEILYDLAKNSKGNEM